MAIPKKIDAAATYRVKLTKPVEVSPGVWARRGDDVTLKGSRVDGLRDSIESAEKI